MTQTQSPHISRLHEIAKELAAETRIDEPADLALAAEHMEDLENQINNLKSTDPGKAVMEFAETIIGAYESGSVNSHMLSIGELYRIAQTHTKDHYNHEAIDIDQAWNHSFALECFHGKTYDKPPVAWSLWKHKGSGQIHQVVTIANLNSGQPEYPTQVIYDDGKSRRQSKTIGEFMTEFEYSQW